MTSRQRSPTDTTEAIRAAFRRLSSTLSDIAEAADASVRARCPHRGVRSRCHYRARCRNQRARGTDVLCGGDALVRFEPVSPLGIAVETGSTAQAGGGGE